MTHQWWWSLSTKSGLWQMMTSCQHVNACVAVFNMSTLVLQCFGCYVHLWLHQHCYGFVFAAQLLYKSVKRFMWWLMFEWHTWSLGLHKMCMHDCNPLLPWGTLYVWASTGVCHTLAWRTPLPHPPTECHWCQVELSNNTDCTFWQWISSNLTMHLVFPSMPWQTTICVIQVSGLSLLMSLHWSLQQMWKQLPSPEYKLKYAAHVQHTCVLDCWLYVSGSTSGDSPSMPLRWRGKVL